MNLNLCSTPFSIDLLETDVGLLGAEVGAHVAQHRHLSGEKAVVHEQVVVAMEVVHSYCHVSCITWAW